MPNGVYLALTWMRRNESNNSVCAGGGPGREGASAPPPAKRPNKHPAPMQRPSREQYAAMCARAQATGQPLPAHVFAHVSALTRYGSTDSSVIQ